MKVGHQGSSIAAKDGVLADTGTKKPRFFYGYVVVAVSVFIFTLAYGAQYSYGVFFKPLSNDFGWTRAMTSGAYSMNLFLRGLFFIVAGGINDRFGPRVIVIFSGLLLGLGYFLMSQISTVWHLYLVYGLIVAIGMGACVVPIQSTVTRWFVKRRGLMNGIVVAGIGLGTMIMPPVATWLISSFGWQMSFAIVGVGSLVLVVGTAQFLRRDPAAIGLLPYGASETKTGASAQTKSVSYRAALRTKQFWMIGAILFFSGFSIHAFMVHVVPYATDLGMSATIAANIMAVTGLLGTIGRVLMGGTADRTGSRVAMSISLVLLSVSLVMLLPARGVGIFYLLAAIFGFGYGGNSASHSPLVAELFGLTSHGVILGSAIFFFTAGGAVGPLVTGYIFDVTSSYELAFLIGAALNTIAIVLSLLLRPPSAKAVK